VRPSRIWQGLRSSLDFSHETPITEAKPRRPQGNPARELDRFSRMSPKERQEQLAKLPPARRQQIEQRLERYQKLPQQQREQLRKR
jgi:hypothetical protein